ncbi:MAG: hypothetical protein K6F13_05315 [Lachnospiraceae bacterium]|nr:hypothetical protein [Lachnospiraceae bacterium]
MMNAAEKRTRNFPVHRFMAALVAVAVTLSAAVSVHLNTYVSHAFSADTGPVIVSHRGGGNAGPENTVAGLRAAQEAGAIACEVDVQRTADGAYVLNHDATFERVAGVDRRVDEMTLEEIRELNVDGERVPTLQELLGAAGRSMILLIELKGDTADAQMADDVVAMIREYGVEDRCILISFLGEVIDYIAEAYPWMPTCYLTFAYDEDAAQRDCDYVGVKRTNVTQEVIDQAHDQGHRILVWTVNEEEEQRAFIEQGADGIVTDEVAQAMRLTGGTDSGTFSTLLHLLRATVEQTA